MVRKVPQVHVKNRGSVSYNKSEGASKILILKPKLFSYMQVQRTCTHDIRSDYEKTEFLKTKTKTLKIPIMSHTSSHYIKKIPNFGIFRTTTVLPTCCWWNIMFTLFSNTTSAIFRLVKINVWMKPSPFHSRLFPKLSGAQSIPVGSALFPCSHCFLRVQTSHSHPCYWKNKWRKKGLKTMWQHCILNSKVNSYYILLQKPSHSLSQS